MAVFICLLRGINVAGHHKVKMAELRSLCEALGFESPVTYVQSGNVVFGATGKVSALAGRIEAEFSTRFGFSPKALVLTQKQLRSIVDACPFAEQARANPKAVHVFFLRAKPDKSVVAMLADVESGDDEWQLGKDALYLHTPNGFGRSKLAEVIDRKLKVPATARNWRSVEAIVDLAHGIEAR